MAFGVIPFAFRRSRWVLAAWAFSLFAFYAVSFGVDLIMPPAAWLGAAAACVPLKAAKK